MIDIIPTDLWAFYVFGIGANIAAIIVMFIVTVIKGFTLTKEDLVEFSRFSQSTRNYIAKNNSTVRIIMSRLLFFIPGYNVMIALVYTIKVFLNKGLSGIIIGSIAIEEYSFIPLIRLNKPEG